MNRKPEEYIALPNNKIGVVLTRGKVAIIDPESLPLIQGRRWQTRTKGLNNYAFCKMKVGDVRKTVRMHQLILPPKEGFVCDHIDSNGLNNTKANLRYASLGENNRNRRPNSATKGSKFKGVYYAPTYARCGKGKKWASKISVDKKSVNLGQFDCELEAARTYDRAALEMHGEFAYLNFPDSKLRNAGVIV